MYTILMDDKKNLITTVRNTIHYKENGVDKIQFLLPPQYDDINIVEYTITLKYVDPYGNFHTEVLVPDEELYKNYLRYTLPVTTQLTQVVGVITLRLSIIQFLPGEETTVINKLDTNSTTLTVSKPDGFVDYVSFEDIEAWKKQLANMNKDITELQDEMPTDLKIDEETDNLHLVHGDEQIGEGVEILTPVNFDDFDDDNDGIIDTDNIQDEPQGGFIEL